MPTLSLDLIIISIIGLMAIYGLLLGPEKIKTLAMSVFVGIVLGSQIAPILKTFADNRNFGLLKDISLQGYRLTLLILPIPLLELERRRTHGRKRRNFNSKLIPTLFLAILVGFLIVAAGLGMLDADNLQHTINSSFLASVVYTLRYWWIGLTPLAIIAEAFIKPKEID